MAFESISKGIAEGLAKINEKAGEDFATNGDFVKDGLLHCGKCGTPKETLVELFPASAPVKVPVVCSCEQERLDREEAEDKKRQFAYSLVQMRERFGVQMRNTAVQTFDMDDNPDNSIARTCRDYVSKWDEMRKRNIGILFYGAKGAGKSFYAECIANALAEKKVPTAVTTTAHLMSILQGEWRKADVIENLNAFSLLVLDDIGAERDTSYGAELMYAVIDARYRVKLPLIVTTNYDIGDLKKEQDLWRSRIYDRIIEMCPIAIQMGGNSRRIGLADERTEIAREIVRRARSEH